MKQKLKTGWEYDWTSKKCRHVMSWDAGIGKYIKKGMNKRMRQEGRKEVNNDR